MEWGSRSFIVASISRQKMTKILGSQGPAIEKNKFIILALGMDEDTRGRGSLLVKAVPPGQRIAVEKQECIWQLRNVLTKQKWSN
jgi:hypothetical protein